MKTFFYQVTNKDEILDQGIIDRNTVNSAVDCSKEGLIKSKNIRDAILELTSRGFAILELRPATEEDKKIIALRVQQARMSRKKVESAIIARSSLRLRFLIIDWKYLMIVGVLAIFFVLYWAYRE